VIQLYLSIPRENNAENLTIFQRILKLDLVGASILIPAVICLLLALQWGGSTYPWSNSRVIGLFVGAGLLGILFTYSQIRLGEKGTLPPRLFRDRNIPFAMAFAFFFGAAFFSIIYYLAIYFQSVKGSSATKAGVQLLPLLISTVLSSVLTGVLVSVIGYYVPVMLVSMAFFAIGSGLITTFSLHTTTGQWFGYQVLAGAGVGIGFQGSILVIQTVLPLSDIPVGTACVSFFQQLGGALFIPVAQSLFQNGLLSGIQKYEPGLDAQVFLHSGATEIRTILRAMHREDALDGIRQAYVDGLTNTFWITASCSIVAFLCACGLQWKSVKKGPEQEKLHEEESKAKSIEGFEVEKKDGDSEGR